MSTKEEGMVLRTVYLPPELDQELRKIAYEDQTSKGELIRESIRALIRGRTEAQPDAIGE